ncbi:MAG TPA: autotransporter outer membrane beta-barrel domain-containing protein, partial [Pseudolabrys sp.]
FGACGCGGIISTGSTVNFSGGGPYVLVGDQIATLDPTAFALADKSLMDFSGFISSLLGNRFGEFAFTGSTPTAFAPAYNGIVDGANTAIGNALAYAGDSRVPNAMAADRASGIAVWSKGFVGGRHQDADGPNLGAGSLAYGGAVGLDRQFTAALRLGAFLGAGNGRLNVDSGSQTVKTDYAFGGVYGRYNWAAQFLDFAVTGGSMGNSSNRTVADNINGLQTASASYNGWFVSPELATGIHIPQGANVVMTPTARIRYLAGGLDGYSEAGSAQNLTVASRVMQNVEERIELAFERTDPLKQGVLKTITTIGVLGQERLGSTTINTVLIGQPLSFAATGANDVAGGYLGLGFDYRMTQRINLFAAVEATVRSDLSQTGIAQGGLRIALD